VGVRGDNRGQRFAAWVPLSAISQLISPEDVVGHIDDIDPDFAVAKAAKSASDLLKTFGLTWGVTGSVGFTLATGFNAIHAASDLDLVVRVGAETVIGEREWRHISTSLASLPCRVDARICAPIGEISLDEYVTTSSEPVLVRTAEGPKLILDPLGAR
jgi:phosphoribosyl-dephospho-CoA transferase